MVIYSGFSHEKWWSSIAMLVYQRVIHYVLNHGFLIFLGLFLILGAHAQVTTFGLAWGVPTLGLQACQGHGPGSTPFGFEGKHACHAAAYWPLASGRKSWITATDPLLQAVCSQLFLFHPFSFESMFNIANLPKLCPEKQSNIIQLYNIDTKPSKIIWNHLKHVKSSKTN